MNIRDKKQLDLQYYLMKAADIAGVEMEKVLLKMYRDYLEGDQYAKNLLEHTYTLQKLRRYYGLRPVQGMHGRVGTVTARE